MGGQFSATSQFYLYGRNYCTRHGWLAASAKYPKPDVLTTVDLSEKVYIVTGANAGLGLGIAEYLASRGGRVYMFCRSQERGLKTCNEISAKTSSNKVHLVVCDCSLEASVRAGWAEFVTCEKTRLRGTFGQSSDTVYLDALVCNAGGLDHKLTRTSEGVETTFAAHLLFGTYLLATLATPCMINSGGRDPAFGPSRVIAVSSGGMYNTALPDWETLTSGPRSTRNYDGQLAYASMKRAQVLLCERWTKTYAADVSAGRILFVSCHPGWVDTPGVDGAYGENKKYLQPLRSVWEGTEGIAWLAAAPTAVSAPSVKDSKKTPKPAIESGAFYLDRSPCVKHLAGPFFTGGSFTRNSERDVDAMMAGLERWSCAATRPPPPTPPLSPTTSPNASTEQLSRG